MTYDLSTFKSLNVGDNVYVIAYPYTEAAQIIKCKIDSILWKIQGDENYRIVVTGDKSKLISGDRIDVFYRSRFNYKSWGSVVFKTLDDAEFKFYGGK